MPLRNRGGDAWEISVELPRDAKTGRRRRSCIRVHGTRRDAQRALTRAMHERDTGTGTTPDRLTVGEFLERWVEDSARVRVAPSTLRRYEQLVARLTHLLGAVRLQALRPARIQEAYTRLADDGLAARTVLHHHRVLRQALQHALRWQLIARNPADAVTPPKPVDREMRALDPAEVRRMLEACDAPQLRAIIHTAVTTGLRLGEILGLRWADIDFEAATASIRRTSRYLSGEGITTGPPKTARGRRTIALSAETVRILREHRARQLSHRLLLGPAFQDGDWVFPDALGALQPPYRVSDTFHRFVARTDLGPVRFHDLRHTAATLMMQAGVPTKIVSTRLGHASSAMTLDIYTHVTVDMQREAVAAIDEVLAAPEPVAETT